MRKFTTGLLVAALITGCMPAASAAAASAPVIFHVYDKSGNRLSWSAFRALQENGKGANGDNDMLLDPTTLTVKKAWPLYRDGAGDPTVDWPGSVTTLSMAWPSSDGYSNLLLDLKGPGTFDFTFLAAQQGVASLDRMLAARPAYVPSSAFTTANQAAHGELAAASAAATEASQGALGAQAYEAAVHATLLLLTEYGTQYGRLRKATGVPTVWGVTYDTVTGGTQGLQSASALVGPTTANGWVRIVFDLAEPASYYVAAVASAHALGLRVVGQTLDSSDMSRQTLTQWKTRVNSYLSVLPSVDEWEVGNEVNGNWLGSGVAAKVAYAAQAVKANTKARTLLTLYYQLGEDDAAHSMFTWAHSQLTATTMANIDDLGLSVYPEDHPMGIALDRVLTTLHATYPGQQVMITELGYWSVDLGHTWSWGSVADPTGAGRQAVAATYSAAILGYAWSRGGTFWWYFPEEAPQGAALWTSMRNVYTAVNS